MKVIDTKKETEHVEIGDWVISAEYGILSGPEVQPIILEPRLAKLLYLLVKNSNAIVARTYLISNIWTDTIVNDESVTRAIADLRKKLQQSAINNFQIETVPKRGYRLTLISKQIEQPKEKKHKGWYHVAAGLSLLLCFLISVLWVTGALKIVVD